MKKLIIILVLFPLLSISQSADENLKGKWQLFEIIDIMSGDVIKPSHKSNPEHLYFVTFFDSTIKYNLEINSCENEIIFGKDQSFEFKYFSSCTEICCDSSFSKLLTYTACTKYYIKESKTLIMVSEERIFYFSKQIAESEE